MSSLGKEFVFGLTSGAFRRSILPENKRFVLDGGGFWGRLIERLQIWRRRAELHDKGAGDGEAETDKDSNALPLLPFFCAT